MIDDDPGKFKKRIGSLTVFGSTQDLPQLVENLFIDQVIIAMPSAPASEIRRIVEMCRKAEVETRILPGLYELINGRVSVSQLREVSLEDLLGREPVRFIRHRLPDTLKDVRSLSQAQADRLAVSCAVRFCVSNRANSYF